MIENDLAREFARICETDSYESLSREAADFIAGEIRRHPDLLLCAAAGSTPTRTYHLLAEQRLVEPHIFDALRVIKLDEWGGLEMHHEATCEAYLQEHLIRPLGISPGRYIAFQSKPEDPAAECERLRNVLASHFPIGVCVLGLGVNGHLGLNEPADSLQPFVHLANLAGSSLRHPMLTPANGQVTYGFTLGIVDILRSKKILLLVSGSHKRHQLRRLFAPEISPHFPASFLRLHPDVTLLCDRDSTEGR